MHSSENFRYPSFVPSSFYCYLCFRILKFRFAKTKFSSFPRTFSFFGRVSFFFHHHHGDLRKRVRVAGTLDEGTRASKVVRPPPHGTKRPPCRSGTATHGTACSCVVPEATATATATAAAARAHRFPIRVPGTRRGRLSRRRCHATDRCFVLARNPRFGTAKMFVVRCGRD